MKGWIDQELANHPTLTIHGYNGKSSDPNYVNDRQIFYERQDQIVMAIKFLSHFRYVGKMVPRNAIPSDIIAEHIEIVNNLPANSFPHGVVIIAARMLGRTLKQIHPRDPDVLVALPKYQKNLKHFFHLDV